MSSTREALAHPIHRAKLRRPGVGDGLVARPRLTSRLDGSLKAPLTLISASAGFGKTTLLAEWATTFPAPLAWLTVDAGDREFSRFVAHVVAAIETVAPDISLPVLELFRRPGTMAAAEVGASLADELLDLPGDTVLVIDDYQLAASAEVENFLGGVLQPGAPRFHLLLSTRNDPALPLARMRLHGQLNELRAADLQFTSEEVHALLNISGQADADPALVSVLQEQFEGWIAGLRLVTLAMPAVQDPERLATVIAGEHHLMRFLVEEVLTKQPAETQDFLLRTAIVDQVTPPLADALLDRAPPGSSRAVLESLVQANLFLEPANREGEWFRFHPLFRSLLLHQLERRLAHDEIAALHTRASAWFAAQGMLDEAIRHRVAAGDMDGAASLVADHVHAALDREDWVALAGWLEQIPESHIRQIPTLLLARAAVSELSGRLAPMGAVLADLESLLAQGDADEITTAALRAQRDVLSLMPMLTIDFDPWGALRMADRAVEHAPAEQRYLAGLAMTLRGCALQATGQTAEAVRWLTAAIERDEDRIDVRTIRTLLGLMLVHRHDGNFWACEAAARQLLTLTERHDMPAAAGSERWALGWIAYEHDRLETAIEHFTAIAADYRRGNLRTCFEAMLGLALSYQAGQKRFEADQAVQRLTEIVLDTNALEYLPTIRGFEARLALLRGQLQTAFAWLAAGDASIESNTLYASEHALITRVKVLLVEGSRESLAQASRDVDALAQAAETSHHHTRLVEILALAAFVRDARGQTDAALAALARSVALGRRGGFCRTYVDLGPALLPLLERLAAQETPTPYLERLLTAIGETEVSRPQDGADAETASPAPHVLEVLTPREAEVLDCLARRLSYNEIGEHLFIALPTVKSHMVRIYDKLGVDNRRQALAKAEALGWTTPAEPARPPARRGA